VHPKASWTSLIWALYQVDNAKDYYCWTVHRHCPPATYRIPAGQAGRSRIACFDAETHKLVCRGNESAPCWWRVCQPRHDDCAEDGVQAGVCHPVMPQYTESIYSDWALSLVTWRRWSDGDKWVTWDLHPRILSYRERCRAAVAAVLHLEFWKTISLVLKTFNFKLFSAAQSATLSVSGVRVPTLADRMTRYVSYRPQT